MNTSKIVNKIHVSNADLSAAEMSLVRKALSSLEALQKAIECLHRISEDYHPDPLTDIHATLLDIEPVVANPIVSDKLADKYTTCAVCGSIIPDVNYKQLLKKAKDLDRKYCKKSKKVKNAKIN